MAGGPMVPQPWTGVSRGDRGFAREGWLQGYDGWSSLGHPLAQGNQLFLEVGGAGSEWEGPRRAPAVSGRGHVARSFGAAGSRAAGRDQEPRYQAVWELGGGDTAPFVLERAEFCQHRRTGLLRPRGRGSR